MKLTSPVISEKTKHGEVFYDIQSRLIKDRIIFLYEEIDDDIASVIIPLLFMMDNEDHEKKISLWVHSPGGSVDACNAIADMMQIIKAPVETICVGRASSGGAILMAAGDKGTRSCTPNSRFMIHQIQVGGVPHGSFSNVSDHINEIKFMNDNIITNLAIHTGQPFDKVMMDCQKDLYLNPQEAIEYGIIDRIIPYSKVLPILNTGNKKVPLKRAPLTVAVKPKKSVSKSKVKK